MNKSKDKILVVNASSQEYKHDLEKAGYITHFPLTFEEAISCILNDTDYKLIIVDSKQSQLRVWKILEIIRSNEFNTRLPIIVIFSRASISDQAHAINLGADDCISRPLNSLELIIKIKSLIRRCNWSPKTNIKAAFSYQIMQNLSHRQLEILNLTSQGYSNKEIASILFVSERTIKAHLSSIFEKLSVTSRTQAAIVAIKEGLAS